ncbi:MAG: hypothetical protein H0A76_12935 [Candidatus Thiodubiliella endoseptemdiera]|uniref:Uncharacterized protein n=1 Tax=Candidatus Thiodubiliella endoseptemdiera TaxID=2738886 RepID=A0A853F576_9GAMM|nr:hypothetical protein [Candidatus Thiodubiliella endoseptemdiera]
MIFEERTFTTKKGGFKDLSQITVFAILFTGKIALFGNTRAKLNCGKVCILSTTIIKDYW